MTIYFSSDHHFLHRNILKYDHRPFASIEEHDAELVRRWNKKVKPEDTVYYLGDFCFSSIERCLNLKNQLNGNKMILIKGNHDGSVTRMKKIFNEVYKTLIIDFHGRKVRLSHYPYTDNPERGPQNDGMWLLHGHTHSKGHKVHDKQINVGVVFWDYYPVSEYEILSIMNKVETPSWWKRILRRLK